MDLDKALTRLGGDKQLLSDLIGFYLEDYADLLDEVEQALGAHDAEALEKASHSLKGLIANFNDEQCREVAQKIESAAKMRDLDLARTLTPYLRKQAHTLAERLANNRISASE